MRVLMYVMLQTQQDLAYSIKCDESTTQGQWPIPNVKHWMVVECVFQYLQNTFQIQIMI
jgi:hypothetical protein